MHMTTRGKRWTAAGIAVFGIAAAGGMGWWMNRQPVQSSMSPFASAVQTAAATATPREQVPVLFDSPAFECVSQDGQRTSNTELKGRIWVADFIFTHCAGSCPKVTAKFTELQKEI